MDAPPAYQSDDAPDDVLEAVPHPRRWLRLAPLILIVLAMIGAVALGAPRYLSLEALSEQRAMLVAFVARHPWESLLVYVVAYTLVVALAIPCALAMTLSGGFLFGVVVGSAAACVGVTCGAVVMFLVARSALADLILSRFPEGGRLKRIEAKIREHAFSYLLTLRLIPMMPLVLVNVAAGLVRMRLGAYVLATVLGIAPSCVVYASVGAGLGHVFDHGGKLSAELALDPLIIGSLLGLVVLSLTPFAYHLYRRRRALPRVVG